MESLLTLPLAGEARVRILQITDTHLFAQKHEALLGVNTWESYQAVLEAIRPHQHEFDLIVATGDLAQDQSSAAYQHFAEGIASFRAPCVWLPGNHDFQPAMYSALQDAGISPAKRVFIGEQWQILLLDSQVFGVPHGVNRPGFPGECFICELRLPDHRFRWKHNKLFLLLPEEYGPAFPAIVDCYTSPPTLVWPVPLLHGFSSSYGVLPPLCKDH
ncbi:diguanylate phosphodiesterase [Escherichia coli O157:H7 str. 2009EL1705]|nr:diguanylate phosphodiesterase [Escherichia coli O157:H7 str. 2009EL1705]